MRNSSNRPAYLEAITKLDLEMKSDARFHDIRWYTQKDFSSGPSASTPVDDEPAPKSPAKRRGWLGRLIGRSSAAPSREGDA